jgi:hypothetical protein
MGEPWVCNPQRARRFESKVSSLGFFDRHYGAIAVWCGGVVFELRTRTKGRFSL